MDVHGRAGPPRAVAAACSSRARPPGRQKPLIRREKVSGEPDQFSSAFWLSVQFVPLIHTRAKRSLIANYNLLLRLPWQQKPNPNDEVCLMVVSCFVSLCICYFFAVEKKSFSPPPSTSLHYFLLD
jgi:hypothetical protein